MHPDQNGDGRPLTAAAGQSKRRCNRHRIDDAHITAVNPDSTDTPIRAFGTFTCDLHGLARHQSLLPLHIRPAVAQIENIRLAVMLNIRFSLSRWNI